MKVREVITYKHYFEEFFKAVRLMEEYYKEKKKRCQNEYKDIRSD